jgi:class 3 adenylate cyclase
VSLPADEHFAARALIAVVFGLCWPHIAFWLATRRAAGPHAERFNVVLDGLFSGLGAAAFSFRLWPVTALIVVNIINALLFGGPRFLVQVLALFFLGFVVGTFALGFELHFDTEPLPTLLSIVAIVANVALIGTTAYRLRLRQREMRLALENEERKSQALLTNVFPRPVIPRLRAGESPIADQFADVTVIFVDMVDFTPLSERRGPKGMVLLLNELFGKFDAAAARLGVEKIETTGDGYLAVGGAPEPLDHHPQAVAEFGLAVLDAARATRVSESEHVEVRVGIHTGPVFGGVIGESRFHYKIFGETVNVASRIQAQSRPGRVLVSETAYKRLRTLYVLEEHGAIDLKGHGAMRTYWLTSSLRGAR